MDLETYAKFAYGRWPATVVCGAGVKVSGDICGVTARGTDNATFDIGCVPEEGGGFAPSENDIATLNVFYSVALSVVACKTGQLQVHFFPVASANRWDNLD